MADPQSDLAAVRTSRAVTLSQHIPPIIALGLVICVMVLVVFAGYALITGKLDSSNFGAIAAYLFGSLSGILGAAASRAPQRATDPTSTTGTGTTGTNGTATVTATVKS